MPTPALSMPPAAPAIATMPQPPHPPMPPSPPAAALLPGSHAATAAAIPSQPPMPPSGMAPTSPPSHSNSLARRGFTRGASRNWSSNWPTSSAGSEAQIGIASDIGYQRCVRCAHLAGSKLPTKSKSIPTKSRRRHQRVRGTETQSPMLFPPLDTAAPSDTPARTEFTAGRR